MAFKPGQSGNPSGRPKKLLKRIDEVLSERGVEPIAEVLKILDALGRQKATGKTAEERAQKRAAAKQAQLKIWLEILPYVYARPRELPEEAGGDAPGRSRLAALSDGELLRLVKEKPAG